MFVVVATRAETLQIVGTWKVVYEYTVGRGSIFLVGGDDPMVRPIVSVTFAVDGTGELTMIGREPRRLFWETVPANDPYGPSEHILANVQGAGALRWFFVDLPDGRRMWSLVQQSIQENSRGMDVQIYAVIERVP